MAKYNYTCENGHVQSVEHLMIDDPYVGCIICNQEMSRMIPTGIRYYHNPVDTLGDMADEGLGNWKQKQKAKGVI